MYRLQSPVLGKGEDEHPDRHMPYSMMVNTIKKS